MYFITNHNLAKTQIINSFEVNLFKSLSGCKTIKEHMKSINESDEFIINESILYGIMKNWIRTGLLRNENLLFEQIHKYHKRSCTGEMIFSGCITGNRPDMLNRWLESRVNTADYAEKKTPIIICDDTQAEKIIKSNKKITDSYRKNYPGQIHYIDMRKKIILSEKIRQLLPEEVPERLLPFTLSINHPYKGEKTPGSNRNALLLTSAGNNIYTSDDDIEYSFFSRPLENTGYSFPDSKILSPLFFPDMNTMINRFKNHDEFSLITYFENLIGSDISEFPEQKLSVSLNNITPQTAMFQEKGLLKIRTVSAGYCGGRWYQSPYRPLIQQNKEREDYFYDYEKYIMIRDNGLNIMSADKNTLVNGDALMGGTLCMDNRKILPPCFPLGMRDDTCFSILLENCLEAGLNIHLPIALYHNPEEKLPFTPENFQDVSVNTGTYSILILEKLSSSFIHQESKERFKELGAYLRNFGKMDGTDFEEQLKLIQLGFLTKIMEHIIYLLDLYENKPPWWAEDMKKYYALLEKEALSEKSVIPRELREYDTKEEALSVFQNYLYGCGEMLFWWPEIWEAAERLNRENRGIIDLHN